MKRRYSKMISYRHNSWQRRIWNKNGGDDRRDGAYYKNDIKIYIHAGQMTKHKIAYNVNHLMNKHADVEYDII